MGTNTGAEAGRSRVTDPGSGLRCGAGLSSLPDSGAAAEEACARALASLGGVPPALLFVSYSEQHVGAADQIARRAADSAGTGAVLGVSAESVIAGETELENSPGVSVFALSAPGVRVRTHVAADGGSMDLEQAGPAERAAADLGLGPETRAVLFVADPFSVPLVKLLPALNDARDRACGIGTAPILGGLASVGRRGGGNALIVGERVLRSGSVSASLEGPIEVGTLVSQGCRAFGPAMVITKSRSNVILGIGGKRALSAVGEYIDALGEEDRRKLTGGLFVGIAVNEYKDRFGRNDFLIRPVTGLDHETGAIAVGDLVRTGQTIRLHFRDGQTAEDDLAMLLDAERLNARPAGALLCCCTGRGTRMFRTAHHDAGAIVRAFRTPPGGETLAKGGFAAGAGPEPPLPLAGFFAAGEIGPVGARSYLHGQTACAAFFRPPRAPAE